MKVTNIRFDILEKAIENVFNRNVSFVKNYNMDESAVEFKINWSCIGETDPKETRAFAEDLIFLSMLAEKINKCFYDIVFEDDQLIKTKKDADVWFDNLKATLENRKKYNSGTIVMAILTYFEM